MSDEKQWYELADADEVPSPALLIFEERVKQNIQHMIDIAGDKNRLRPHIKTHKLGPVIKMHQAVGIDKLKCATIAEAELAATCDVADILLAYQPVGPNQQRLIDLAIRYPNSQFGCLLDNEKTYRQLIAKLSQSDITLNVWIDIDNGMARSGTPPGPAAEQLAKLLVDSPQIRFRGLHVYDGQFGGYEIGERIEKSDEAYAAVNAMIERLAADNVSIPNVVAGGSPTFPVHALQTERDLSPGTYSLWDIGYGTKLPELPFLHAAILMSRVISAPKPNRLCVDLGHKAVSAENPIENRVRFLNAPEAKFMGQSEEHLIIELPDGHGLEVGDVLYGVPYHVCPTVALYQEAVVVEPAGSVIARWPILARDRRIGV